MTSGYSAFPGWPSRPYLPLVTLDQSHIPKSLQLMLSSPITKGQDFTWGGVSTWLVTVGEWPLAAGEDLRSHGTLPPLRQVCRN